MFWFLNTPNTLLFSIFILCLCLLATYWFQREEKEEGEYERVSQIIWDEVLPLNSRPDPNPLEVI